MVPILLRPAHSLRVRTQLNVHSGSAEEIQQAVRCVTLASACTATRALYDVAEDDDPGDGAGRDQIQSERAAAKDP